MALRGLRIWVYFKKRWVRRLCVAGGVFLLLALLLSIMPSLVNKRSLRAKVRDWTIARLDQSCPVSVGEVDLALRINGRTDLYIHNYELDTPNPRFDLPWLFVDTFRASAPAYALLGGVGTDPVVQVRDGVLRLMWDQRGNFNLSGLTVDPAGWQPPVMQHMRIGTIDVQFQKCRVVVARPDLSGQLRVEGHLRVEEGRSRLEFLTQDGVFEMKTQSGRELKTISCSVSRAEYDRRQQRLTALSGAVKNVPLRLAELLMPQLPLRNSDATATGAISVDGKRWSFDGQVRGLGLSEFGEEVGAQFSVEAAPEGGRTVRLELRELLRKDPASALTPAEKVIAGSTGAPSLAIAARRDAAGAWQGLSAYCARLDLDALAQRQEHPWLEYLARNFRSARIDGDRVRLAGFELGKVALDMMPTPDGTANVSLNGEIAGGRLALLAKQMPLGGGRPQSVLGSLIIPNAADTLLRFSGLLPPVLQCSPIGGSGELTIRYDAQPASAGEAAGGSGAASDKRDGRAGREPVAAGAAASDQAALKSALRESAFELRLDLQKVRIPALTGGALVQELAGVPRRLVELENLCRRAQIRQQPALPVPPEGWEQLDFSALQISYDIAPGGQQRLHGVLAQSPQLGQLEGTGVPGDDGTLRIRFVIRNLPDGVVAKNAGLSPAVRAALAQVMRERGLRIECHVGDKPGTGTVEPLYMQDVFRVWSESAGKPPALSQQPQQPGQEQAPAEGAK